MSVLSYTFSSNDTLLHSLIDSTLSLDLDCFIVEPNSLIFTTCTVINIILLLPLSIFILHRGLQQWRQPRSSTTAATTSHSDTFTYNVVTVEIFFVFACILCCCGIYRNNFQVLVIWFYVYSFCWYGETSFHILTCVERYLAVVHPITYLSLRKERGTRIRNVTIGCVWLLCIGGIILAVLRRSLILDLFLVISSLVIISYCSVSVLCVLFRPGPEKQEWDRGRVDQSKLKTVYTIMAILGVLLLRCSWDLVWLVQTVFGGVISECLWNICALWIDIPSRLVLPLLFLHRAEILACCK